jgi:hypothetical protein
MDAFWPPHHYWIVAMFDGTCSICGLRIHADISRIQRVKDFGWVHLRCARTRAA